MKDKWTRYEYRKQRTRENLREATINSGRPRLTVHRSLKYIYAQVVDDATGKTLAYASSQPGKSAKGGKSAKNLDSAKKVGEAVAKKAIAAGVKQVAFDRGGHIYHGRVKALAEAARAGGLEF